MNRQTVLCVKQINNKDLLNSTGNHIQYLVKTYNGNNLKKNMYVCVCVYMYKHIYN